MPFSLIIRSFVRRSLRVLPALLTIASGCLVEADPFSTIFTFPSDRLHASKLIQAGDGNFYGTTQYGGAHFKGSVFKISPAGTFTTLYDFTGQNDGAFPNGGVVEGPDGNFYGSTTDSYPALFGTIFKISPAGALTTIYHFSGVSGADGSGPSPVILATDGNFYGTTSNGGANFAGSVFQITSAGVFSTACSFPANVFSNSRAALVQGADGNFYGATTFGISILGGVAFKATSAGVFTILHEFTFQGSRVVVPGLCRASDGNFYGVRERDGSHSQGLIYRITPDGDFTAIHNFTGPGDGARPQGSLVQGGDGNLYGTTTTAGPDGGGTLFRMTLAGVLTTLKSFSSDILQQRIPEVGLALATDGNLYGVTSLGGTSNRGIMFKLSTAGVFDPVADFPGSILGSNPTSLVQGAGAIFGTTSLGGTKNNGTIFKRSTSGAVTTFHSFSGMADGATPSKLIRAKDGNFYGTTSAGIGASSAGTIFQVTPAGAFTTLATFPVNLSKGGMPSSLVQATDGNFYGTTQLGGSNGKGTVFKCTSTGGLTTFRNFSGLTDGGSPQAALVRASDGNLYGLTPTGGSHSLGTIFKLSLSGNLSTIYNIADPLGWQFALVQSYDGNLYGVFEGDGANGAGEIVRVTTTGAVTFLHSFASYEEGAFPWSPLIQAADGRFYGVTLVGGLPLFSNGSGNGTLFRYSTSAGLQTIHAFSQGFASDTGPPSSVIEGADGNFYGTTTNVGGTLFQLTFPPLVFANISTRLKVGTGEDVLICGFIITGSQPKKVIIRGLGPSLMAAGLSGVLANPVLELHNSAGQLIALNDNWGTSMNKQAIIDSGVPPTNAKESAILMTLNPGSYTAILRGVSNGTGIGLIEAYDLDTAAHSELANISTRGFVQTEDNIMIGGIIVVGNDLVHVIVRATGPSLAQQGITHSLADPILELHDGNGYLLASNDDWMDTQRDQIRATGIPPKDPRECAIIQTLLAGHYTAIVKGKNNTTGVALIEAYHLKF